MKIMAQKEQPRPMGVTIISILGMIVSFLTLISSLALMLISAVLFSGILMLVVLVSVISGMVGLVGFYLLFKMKKTGWIIIFAIGIISVAGSLMMFNIFNMFDIIFWVLVLAYLWTKKDLFA